MRACIYIVTLVVLTFGSATIVCSERREPKPGGAIPNPHHHAKGEDELKDVAPSIKVVESVNGMIPAAACPVMTESSQAPTSPEEAARDFYKWHLHALYENPQSDPLKEHKSDVEKYVTTRLRQKLANSRRTSTARKGPDADTENFFQTLDLNSEWEQNIAVSVATIKGATAVVRVSLSGTNPESKRLEIERDLRVVLKQEGGLWKIDDVGVWR